MCSRYLHAYSALAERMCVRVCIVCLCDAIVCYVCLRVLFLYCACMFVVRCARAFFVHEMWMCLLYAFYFSFIAGSVKVCITWKISLHFFHFIFRAGNENENENETGSA